MNTIKYPILNNCKFHLGDIPDAWQAWYDDTDWEDVTIPHDWSVSNPFSREYSSGTGYLTGGLGWYRFRITPEKSWENKRLILTFDGVYKNSKVWCNSYYLGSRPNGYISFSYDVTEQFHTDKENVFCICVDHRDISDSRWFTGSGITRKVTLTVQESVHVQPDGIAFETPDVTAERADFTAASEIKNTTGKDVLVTVKNKLIPRTDTNAMNNTPAAEAFTKVLIPAGCVKTVQTAGTIDIPKLWSPGTPNLYTLETWLYTEPTEDSVQSTEEMIYTEKLLSSEELPSSEYLADSRAVGIRSIHFDPDRGFFLNGVSTIIKGVCVHHDAGCLGAAVLPAVWERRLKKLKAMGCNAIRMSHNPHMPELYDLCDSMGFLVIDEAFDEWEGPKNKWSTGHNVYPPKHQGYYLDFPQWHEKDLTDLVRRDRCHPSVMMWSIGNEIDYPNDPYCHPSFTTMTGNNDSNKPAQERQYNPDRPNAERLAVLARRLTEIVKKTDTTRPVTLAAAFPELSAKLGFLDSLDVAGYNYKEHLYEESHRAFPDKPFIGSENGHSLEAWKAVTDNSYISGQFLWTGIDFLGEAQGWPIHGSYAGLLTMAGFEKQGYYRRQSFWAAEPVIHLASALASEDCGEWTPVTETWNYPLGEKVLIKCYTNLDEVEIRLNDKSLGFFQKDSKEDSITLTAIYEPGILKAEGKAKDGSAVCHTLTTTGSACQAALTCYETPISDQTQPALYQVEVSMQDTSGNPVYSDSTLLHVSVENGRLLGLENGDLADVTEYSAAYRRAYQGHLLIYAAPFTEGEIPTVHVTGEGITPASLTLASAR